MRTVPHLDFFYYYYFFFWSIEMNSLIFSKELAFRERLLFESQKYPKCVLKKRETHNADAVTDLSYLLQHYRGAKKMA